MLVVLGRNPVYQQDYCLRCETCQTMFKIMWSLGIMIIHDHYLIEWNAYCSRNRTKRVLLHKRNQSISITKKQSIDDIKNDTSYVVPDRKDQEKVTMKTLSLEWNNKQITRNRHQQNKHLLVATIHFPSFKQLTVRHQWPQPINPSSLVCSLIQGIVHTLALSPTASFSLRWTSPARGSLGATGIK